jgi:NADPH-dependent 2,4-dienoyl-CoA reductase/sulfur reductase-like enzyme
VTLLEAMPWPGGQLRLAARNPRRRDLMGIVEWRVGELERLGVAVHYDTFADLDTIAALRPDVVIVATGGLPQNPPLEHGDDLMVNAWDVVGGDVRPTGEGLVYDDDGTHSAMTTAELIARSGARLEIVTPERTVGVDVGGLNLVPYAKALNEADVRITLNQRVMAASRRDDGRIGVQVGSDHSPVRHARVVDVLVGDHGVLANDDLYHELVSHSTNLGEVDHRALVDGHPQTVCTNPGGEFQLFRIGDAVAGRNIHAAIYDALRLCKDL